MRLVKTVFRKARNEVEDRVGGGFGDSIDTITTLDKAAAFLAHFFPILSCPLRGEKVGFAEGIACKHIGGPLNLLLINHDSIGLGTDLLKKRMGCIRQLLALFARD